MRRLLWLIPVAIAAGIMLALTMRGGGDEPLSLPEVVSTTAAVLERTPVPTETPVVRRTDISQVDAILQAVETGDEAQLRGLTRFQTVACQAVFYLEDGVCHRGLAPDTLVEVFASTTCGSDTFALKDEFRFEAKSMKVYAVFRAPPAFEGVYQSLPEADYVAVFAGAEHDSRGLALAIADGEVVKYFPVIDIPPVCSWMPEDFVRGLRLRDAVLAPPEPLEQVARRTSIPGVDAILDAVEAGDIRWVLNRIRFFPIPCATGPRGTVADIPCPQGREPGTPVNVIQVSSCDGTSLLTRSALESNMAASDALTLFAVYLAPDGFEPPAEYVAVFGDPETTRLQQGSLTLAIDSGEIVKVYYALPSVEASRCASAPVEMILALGLTDAVIPPLPQKGAR